MNNRFIGTGRSKIKSIYPYNLVFINNKTSLKNILFKNLLASQFYGSIYVRNDSIRFVVKIICLARGRHVAIRFTDGRGTLRWIHTHAKRTCGNALTNRESACFAKNRRWNVNVTFNNLAIMVDHGPLHKTTLYFESHLHHILAISCISQVKVCYSSMNYAGND